MENRVFVDTNIWIYGLTESDLETDKNKRKISLNLFENILAEGRSIYISVQVINDSPAKSPFLQAMLNVEC